MSNRVLFHLAVLIGIHFGTCLPSMAMSSSCTDFYLLSPKYREPSLRDIRKHVMGVHVTEALPLGGVLKAAYNRGMSMRPTVHFALGEMVISHGSGSWENKPFAVLTPFGHLEPQLLNVFHQDTFIMGDLKLKKGSILIVPEGESVKPIRGVEIRTYVKGQQSLREKIEEVLKEKDQWLFKGSGGQTYDKLKMFGVELDQKAFFKSVYAKYPHVTFGLHYNHPLGQIDHKISDNLTIFRDPNNSTSRDYIDWILLSESLKVLLADSDRFADLFQNAPAVSKVYQAARARFEGRTNVILAEIEIQKRFGKTLLGAKGLSSEFLDQVKAIGENYQQLIEFLESHKDKLSEMKFDKDEVLQKIRYDYSFNDLRNNMNEADFVAFLNSYPEIRDSVGGVEYQLGLKFLDTTKSLPEKSKRYVEMLSSCSYVNCSSVLFRLLKANVGFDKNIILTNDSVAKNLSQVYDLRAFTHLVQKDPDINSWIWFARELYHSKNKEKWWSQGLRLYNFVEVEPKNGAF